MKRSTGEKAFSIFNIVFLVLLCLTMLYPFWNAIVKSFSGNNAIMRNEVSIWPVNFNLYGYRSLFKDSAFYQTLSNTVIITVGGTALRVWLALSVGYAFSKRNLIAYRFLFFFFLFTMFFNGGMIPTFLQVKALGLYDRLLSMILVGSMPIYFMILAKSFFTQLPDSIEESAYVDGANYLQIFLRIVLPISKPLIATLTIFASVMMWNTFMPCILYIQSSVKFTLQVFVRLKVFAMESIQYGNNVEAGQAQAIADMGQFGSETLKMAVVSVTSIPIICVYPFFQKYFIKGITLGAVKG